MLPKLLGRMLAKLLARMLASVLPKLRARMLARVLPKLLALMLDKLRARMLHKLLARMLPRLLAKLFPKLLARLFGRLPDRLHLEPDGDVLDDNRDAPVFRTTSRDTRDTKPSKRLPIEDCGSCQAGRRQMLTAMRPHHFFRTATAGKH
ncbi:MAG: hypothetical protein JSU73_07325 [candidate division WOR-3 bacterium]|nr:MAG: hypothetical protein JSU73_07325 [candidate division WOR-3 bacterium]